MGTANRDPGDLLLGILREIGLTVLGWIGALTALFVVSRPLVSDLEDALGRAGSTETVGDYLPAGDGSLVDQWLTWLGAYLGGDSGHSIQFDRPVAEVVGEAGALSV